MPDARTTITPHLVAVVVYDPEIYTAFRSRAWSSTAAMGGRAAAATQGRGVHL